jgi:hypothetical protein
MKGAQSPQSVTSDRFDIRSREFSCFRQAKRIVVQMFQNQKWRAFSMVEQLSYVREIHELLQNDFLPV